MEGQRSSCVRSDLLQKIRRFTRSIIDDLCNGQSLMVSIFKFRTYCTGSSGNCTCRFDRAVGKEVLMLQRKSNAHRIDVLLRVLLIVQKLLQDNIHCSKRDIYYMHPSCFLEQSVVDRAINDICILLECSRHHLNVVPVAKGLVMGWIRFFEAGKKFDCMNSPNNAQPVPVCVEEVKDIQVKALLCLDNFCDYCRVLISHVSKPPNLNDIFSVAQYILVVEKESVFQRLADDQFCRTNHCIVLTGKGYPDIPTRRFLRLLIDVLHIPAYCLVDSDPYGFDILTTYRFGSMQMAYDAKYLRVPEICWLGAFMSDFEKYALPPQCLLPLSTEDRKRTEAILNRCYLQHEEPQWRLELELMLQKGVKFEIEALSVRSLSFLSKEYLPSKIKGLQELTVPPVQLPKDEIASIDDVEYVSSSQGGFRRFWITWKNRPDCDATWITEDDLRDLAPELLNDFLRFHSPESSSFPVGENDVDKQDFYRNKYKRRNKK